MRYCGVRVDTVAGGNLIFIQPPERVEGLCIPITDIGGAVPITQAVVPASGSVRLTTERR